MRRLPGWLGIVAAATLALSLGACSNKAEETTAEEEVEEVTQSEEQSAEEIEAEEPEEAEGWTISELEGTGPARVDVGYFAFDVGDGVEWWIQTTPEGSSYASVVFGTGKSTDMLVEPSSMDSMEEAVEAYKFKLEGFQHPLEDLGEVTINDVVYHEFARTAPSGKVLLHFVTFYEPLKARVNIETPAAEGTTDFAYPDEVGLMFDTLEFYDGPLED